MPVSASVTSMMLTTDLAGLNYGHRTAQSQAPPTAPLTPAAQGGQPIRSAFHEAPTNTRSAATARPVPTGPSVPVKPAQQTPTPANNIKGIMARPPQQGAVPAKPGLQANKPGPVPSGAPSGTSIPAKPPIQTRQPRGPPSGSAPASNFNKLEKPSENPTSKSPAPVPSKSGTPAPAAQANGKSATPAASYNKEKEKPKAAPSGKKETNGTSTPTAGTNGTKDSSNKDEPKKADGSAESKGEEKEKPKEDKDGASEVTSERTRPQKHSLYLKGLPIPSSEDEIKGLFPDASKVSHLTGGTRSNTEVRSPWSRSSWIMPPRNSG